MVIEQSTTDRNIFIPGWPWTPKVYETGLPIAANWWDPNDDIVCANIWAYRAINSAGTPWPGGPTVYAETLVNLVNPGVNDLIEGNGAVPWAQATGWSFVAAAAQCFLTGVVPTNDQTWSALVQFADTVDSPGAVRPILQTQNANPRLALASNWAGLGRFYASGGWTATLPAVASGNLGISGTQGYFNGVLDTGVIAPIAGAIPQITIGAVIVPGFIYLTGRVLAVVLYDCTLTAPQVLAVATAMSQL